MIKRYFLTGLALLLPFAISLLIVIWLVDLLTDPFLHLAQETLFRNHPFFLENHPTFTLVLSRISVLVFLFFFTLFLGILGEKYIFSKLLAHLQTLFLKVPILRVIYKLCHDITTATLKADSKLFKQTVLIPFPHKDSWAIGLTTSDVPKAFKEQVPEIEIAVFVPTSPHPMSGFVLLTPQKLIKPIDLSAEDAFKYIISCGTTLDLKSTPPESPHV